MEAFNDLRKTAREKRDKAITQARNEYGATLARIAELEQDLLGRDSVNHKPISACIESVIPSDGVFTIPEIVSKLERLDPTREWRTCTVVNYITRLRGRGIVRRVKKSKNRDPATYVRVGVEVEPLPFEDMTLPEVIAAVLEPRQPLRHADLVVAILEAGYETKMKGLRFKEAVGNVLRNDERFSEVGGEWTAEKIPLDRGE